MSLRSPARAWTEDIRCGVPDEADGWHYRRGVTPEVIAAWWGVVVAALIGVGGIVVGSIGVSQARQARTAAKEANDLARVANEHAAEANQIAREANDLSKSTAACSDEQHDVAWEWRFDDQNDGLVWIQNIGKNRALGVVVQFMFRDVTEANPEPMTVEGRQTVRLEIPGLPKRLWPSGTVGRPGPGLSGQSVAPERSCQGLLSRHC